MKLLVQRNIMAVVRGDVDQGVVLKIRGEDAAIGTTGEDDGFGDGDFAFDAAGAGFVHGVVVEVSVAAGGACGVEVEEGGSDTLEGLELEGHGEGIAEGFEGFA